MKTNLAHLNMSAEKTLFKTMMKIIYSPEYKKFMCGTVMRPLRKYGNDYFDLLNYI